MHRPVAKDMKYLIAFPKLFHLQRAYASTESSIRRGLKATERVNRPFDRSSRPFDRNSRPFDRNSRPFDRNARFDSHSGSRSDFRPRERRDNGNSSYEQRKSTPARFDRSSTQDPDARTSGHFDRSTSDRSGRSASNRFDDLTSDRLDKSSSRRFGSSTPRRFDGPSSDRFDRSASKRFDRPTSNGFDRSFSKPFDSPTFDRFDRSASKRVDGDRRGQNFSQSTERTQPQFSSLPFANPLSQFLYGATVVQAALKSKRRQLNKLYIYESRLTTVSPNGGSIPSATLSSLRALALAAGVPIKTVDHTSLSALDRASLSRPHNGVILDCSPLPAHPVLHLRPYKAGMTYLPFSPAPQTAESLDSNGDVGTFALLARSPRKYPLVVLVDSVRDPANLGAILRSAYFLGVSACVIAQKTSAPVTSVAVKASSGGSEVLPILTVENPVDFLTQSAEEGWFIAFAGAPDGQGGREDRQRGGPELGFKGSVTVPTFSSPQSITLLPTELSSSTELIHNQPLLDQAPTILVLGGEGDPVRLALSRRTHAALSIWPSCGAIVSPEDSSSTASLSGVDSSIVDSLNVGVAGALACQWLLSGGAVTQDPALNPDFSFSDE